MEELQRGVLHIIVCIDGWPKSPFSFFHKIQGTFFIFTNNFIDLDILKMVRILRGIMLTILN